MFLGERKPDERYIVRFPQNVDGDYEAYGHPVWMYGPYPVRGVYTQPMRAIPATEACYVIGNESEKLTEVRLRVDAGLDESVSIPAPPSLTSGGLQAGTWAGAWWTGILTPGAKNCPDV